MDVYRITRITANFVFISIMLVSMLAIMAHAQSDAPAPPEFFYGKATVNGKNVPAGSIIVARISNEKRGAIKVTVPGFYGSESTSEKLLVTGSRSSTGKEIQFFVKLPKLLEIKATQTAKWESGSVKKLDLTFVGEEIVDNSTNITSLLDEFNTTRESYFFNSLVAGKQLLISLNNENIPITRLQLIVTKNISNVTFDFETVDAINLPKNIQRLQGVYKYILIEAPKIEQSIVQTAILKFEVPNDWFDANDYDPSSVKLLRYSNNTWNNLVTYHEGTDAHDNYYRAVTPGFSYFAIKAEKVKPANSTQLESQNKETAKLAAEEEKETLKEAPQQVVNQVTTYVVEKVKTNPIIGFVLVLAGILIGILATYYFVVRKKE